MFGKTQDNPVFFVPRNEINWPNQMMVKPFMPVGRLVWTLGLGVAPDSPGLDVSLGLSGAAMM